MLAPLAGRETLQLKPGSQVHSSPQAQGGLPRVALSIRGVRKRFRDQEILRGIDLELTAGEVVALLGPNGAGKSTLLRIIVGTISADAGQVSIGGHDLDDDPQAARAAVSWVLGDEHGWYWRLTGLENLVFFGMLRGLPRREAVARAEEQLSRQRLDAAAYQRVGEYSTGMRARLSLGRASLAPTAVSVLDEPGRGLDVTANERLEEFLTNPKPTAVLLVTHDLEMVSRIAQRSLVLGDGVVAEQLPRGTSPSALASRIAKEG
jgi:ABC-2 type transport system ATP-binding protein